MKTLRCPAAAFGLTPITFVLFFFEWLRRRTGVLVLVGLLGPAGVGAQAVDTAGVRREVDSLIQEFRNLGREGKYEEALPIIDAAENRALAVFGRNSDIYANCLNRKGAIYYYTGQYEKAEKLWNNAKSIRENVLGKNHVDYAASLNNLGILYEALGNYEKSESFHLEAKDIREKALGKKHADYGASLLNLGNLYMVTNNYKKAESLYLEAQSITKEIHSDKHPDYALILNNLAILYYHMSNYEKAETFYLEAKDTREKVFGKVHPDYLQSLMNIAVFYGDRGIYTKADSFYTEAKEIAEKVYQKEHPEYAMLLNNLASFYLNFGKYEKASPLFFEAKSIREKALGKKHPDYANSLRSIAQYYKEIAKYSSALPFFLEAQYLLNELYGNKSVKYAYILVDIGNLYQRMGDYQKSQSHLVEAQSIIESALGKDNSDYALCVSNLALLYMKMSKYSNAEPLFLEAKLIYEKHFGKEHPVYAQVIGNLATLYEEMGEFEKSESLYLESRAIRLKVLGTNHLDYADIQNSIGIFYKKKGDYIKSEAAYMESKEIREKFLGSKNALYGSSLNNLGNLYRTLGNYDKAISYFLESKKIAEEVYGKEHVEYFQRLSNLASCHLGQGDFPEAESLFQIVYQESGRVLGDEHHVCMRNLSGLSYLYYQKGELEKSKSLLKVLINKQEKTLGKNHPEYIESLSLLAAIYQSQQALDSAAVYYVEANTAAKNLIERASFYSSESEMLFYSALYEKMFDRFQTFVSSHATPELSRLIYNNVIFLNGLLLDNARNISQAFISTDSLVHNAYVCWRDNQRRLSHEYAKPITERDGVKELEEEVEVYEKILTRGLSSFKKISHTPDWHEVQDMLRPQEAAIEFICYDFINPKPTDSVIYSALLLFPTDTAPHFIPLFEERQIKALLPADKAIEDLSKSSLRANYIRQLYAAPRTDGNPSLYDLVWAPIEKVLVERGVKTVYYAPSGILHRLNLAALTTGKSGKTLSDQYRLVQLGSTRELTADRTAKNRKPSSAVVYGGVYYDMDSTAIARANSDMAATAQDTTGGLFRYAVRGAGQDQNRGDNWNYLQGSEKEARHLHDLLQQQGISSTLRLGYAATEESFKQIGTKEPSPTLLHIGTHGFFFPDPKDTTRRRSTGFGDDAPAFKISEHPLIRSGLLLAGAKYAWETKRPMHGMEDGILTAHEVSQMNLSNTDLVVLSACETGLGDIKGNEGVYGLQRAFRIAGAKNVLMSLWKVSDEATALLLNRFYENWLQKSMTVRAAFEAAQAWMRGQEKYRNPYYWAGFVLVGE